MAIPENSIVTPLSSTPPPLPEAEKWYYSLDNLQRGPAPIEELRQLLQQGRLQASSLVWTATLGPTWQPISKTPIYTSTPDVPPPPMPSRPVPMWSAWLTAFSAFIGPALSNIIGATGVTAIILIVGVTIVFLTIDMQILKQNQQAFYRQYWGYLAGTVLLAIVFIPLYLFNRAKQTNKKYGPFTAATTLYALVGLNLLYSVFA
jgi:hypothetical protein